MSPAPATTAGDVQKMVAVGLVWGATNALMRRGARIWDQRIRSSAGGGLLGSLRRWSRLAAVWQYTLPFALNLCASAAFFHLLGHSPISVAVPVTNATTFAATAVAAMLLGEETHVGYALLGTASILVGVSMCIS